VTLSADDRAALTDLVHRYAAGVDDRQFNSVADLFTDDAELLLPDPPAALEPVKTHCGRAAIGEAVAAVAATLRTQHAIVGEVYDAGSGPGSALGRIACIAHHWMRHDDQIRDVTWHLRYADEYQLSADAGWRICRRTLTIDAIDTRPVRQVR
jgi:ketosteroid isomerase-like protein